MSDPEDSEERHEKTNRLERHFEGWRSARWPEAFAVAFVGSRTASPHEDQSSA